MHNVESRKLYNSCKALETLVQILSLVDVLKISSNNSKSASRTAELILMWINCVRNSMNAHKTYRQHVAFILLAGFGSGIVCVWVTLCL